MSHNKTVYTISHVDEPLEEIIQSIIDPDDENKPSIYLDRELAVVDLEKFRQTGLEYTIREISLKIS